MAEKTILVCDTCGRPAAETITVKVASGNFVKDLCSTHVDELVAGARKPRPGRRKGAVASAPAARAAPKRRGRPPKAASAKTSSAKRTSRKRASRKRSSATPS